MPDNQQLVIVRQVYGFTEDFIINGYTNMNGKVVLLLGHSVGVGTLNNTIGTTK